MKYILSFFILLILTGLNASPNYIINQKMWVDTLSADSIYITGKVNFKSKVANNSFGKISSLDFKTVTIINQSGEFNITISRKSKGIFFFQKGYSEVKIKLGNMLDFNWVDLDIHANKFGFSKPKYEDIFDKNVKDSGKIKPCKTQKEPSYLFKKNQGGELQNNRDIKKEKETILKK